MKPLDYGAKTYNDGMAFEKRAARYFWNQGFTCQAPDRIITLTNGKHIVLEDKYKKRYFNWKGKDYITVHSQQIDLRLKIDKELPVLIVTGNSTDVKNMKCAWLADLISSKKCIRFTGGYQKFGWDQPHVGLPVEEFKPLINFNLYSYGKTKQGN